MGACELRWERRGVPLTELRFDRRDVGEDILAARVSVERGGCWDVQTPTGRLAVAKRSSPREDVARRARLFTRQPIIASLGKCLRGSLFPLEIEPTTHLPASRLGFTTATPFGLDAVSHPSG